MKKIVLIMAILLAGCSSSVIRKESSTYR